MTLARIMKIGLLLLLVSMAVAGCGGRPPAAPPPTTSTVPPTTPTPPAPAPTITLRAEPATIERGGSVTLQWEARNAASVSITPGVGDVPVTGNRSVSPTSSVTYQATATGPGGSITDIARVTVNIAPAAPPVENDKRPPITTTNLGTFDQGVKDVFFDYDKAEIRGDMTTTLLSNADWLKKNPSARFTIEGHCDERGSEEYNLGLGDRRANAVKEYLQSQGIAASRMNTISYGEARPVCRDESESCFEKNRRAHFAQMP